MINRFHNAVPSVVIPGANSQANKAKPGDGFAALLNALASPVAEQQTGQHPAGLLQEPGVKPELENAATPFNRLIDVAEEAVVLTANHLSLAIAIPGTMAITPPQSVLDATQAEVPLPQALSSDPVFEIPVTVVPVETENEVVQTGLPPMVVSLGAELPATIAISSEFVVVEVPATTAISSEPVVIEEPTSIADIAEHSTVNEASLAPHDIPEAHAAISKRSTTQGGDIELLAMPWRLQANAAMSYQSTAQQLKNIGQTQNVLTTIIQATPDHAVDKNQLQGLSNHGLQYEGVKIDKALEFYRVSEAASALANAFESARSSRADTRASLIMWPQRVLHWLAAGDATTAWVRDYQLDAGATKTLVDALRCFAEQQDISLRRIMLNGHEVWRSPSTF